MESNRFDALARALSALNDRMPDRRSLIAVLAGGLVATGTTTPEVVARRRKRRRKRRHRRRGGGGGGVCSPAFVCSGFGGDAPVCGSAAGGGTCGCYPSMEGTNVCLNESEGGVEIDCTTLQVCETTQDCRDTVGFHFACRKPLANEEGIFCGCDSGRCWPECDNPA